MPIYEYQDRKGNVVELYQSIDEVASIGATIKHKGRMLKRLPPGYRPMPSQDFAHVAYQFDEEDAKRAGVPIDPDTGCPRLSSRAEINNFQARLAEHGDRDRMSYDYGIHRATHRTRRIS